MKLISILRATGAAAALAVTLTACGGSDDEAGWPDENLEMLIGFGAGGTPDLLGRGVGDQLQSEHGVSVTATNRTGGASTIAMNEALSAQADGTTLGLATSNGLLWQPLVEQGLEYSQTEGYEALVKVAESAFSVMVASDSDFATMDDFIAAADSGEELSVAVTGEGAQTDLTVQLLNEQNDWNLRSVPYTDGACRRRHSGRHARRSRRADLHDRRCPGANQRRRRRNSQHFGRGDRTGEPGRPHH